MIYIGYDDPAKRIEIDSYRQAHDIRRVVVISADEFPLPVPGSDQVTYSNVIRYVTFYRLMQEVDQYTLLVINECLRTQNRYDLTYNCIRNFLNQTEHQLIFQQLPQIDTAEDFMILFDFETRSRWKRRKFDLDLILDNAQMRVKPLPLAFEAVEVPTTPATQKKYAKEREKRFATLGAKDPHTIPRNLYLIGGQDKLAYIEAGQLPLFGEIDREQWYVARNKRLNRDWVITYDEATPEQAPYTIIELPHRFIEFSDFIRRSGQAGGRVLLADLKVDHWYFQRYQDWKERICETYASLQQR